MKHLAIKIVGLERIRAYENTEKSDDKQPDFKADGVAVWVNESREERD